MTAKDDTFAIFDAFPDEYGRRAHLEGKVAANLISRAPDLFARPPIIERLDVLADKLPGAMEEESSKIPKRPSSEFHRNL